MELIRKTTIFHINLNSDTFVRYSMEGKDAILRGTRNGVKSSTCIVQTVTDTGFISDCFKQ